LEVGGFGLRVQCSGRALADLRVGARSTLATSLVVREDSLTLFGFANADDRDVFETLQSVSGVGPRLAQAALSVLTADQLRAAVQAQDEVTLTRIPGVGKKGAQRLVLELADKLGSPINPVSVDVRDPAVTGALSWQGPVREALVSLGWSAKESDEAVVAVAAEFARSGDWADHSDQEQTVSRMLALALRGMGKK
ncbi:MAG: Holliday junction branch migration protein RuvA, partial [Actinomycetes bacterium]